MTVPGFARLPRHLLDAHSVTNHHQRGPICPLLTPNLFLHLDYHLARRYLHRFQVGNDDTRSKSASLQLHPHGGWHLLVNCRAAWRQPAQTQQNNKFMR